MDFYSFEDDDTPAAPAGTRVIATIEMEEDPPPPAAPPEDYEGFAALYGPAIQEALDEIMEEVRNMGVVEGVRMLLPVARLRVRLDPAILALGLTVEGLLRQATRFGRPRMGLDGDRAWINIHGGISQTTRAGDFSDLLQAFQDWVAEELGRGEAANEKLRLKFLLLLEGHGSHYAPLQERYRNFLRRNGLADGWGLDWLQQLRERIGVDAWRLTAWEPRSAAQYIGPYSPQLLVRTLERFFFFLERKRQWRRRFR